MSEKDRQSLYHKGHENKVGPVVDRRERIQHAAHEAQMPPSSGGLAASGTSARIVKGSVTLAN